MRLFATFDGRKLRLNPQILGYLYLPGCVTLFKIIQIFSWGAMRIETEPEVCSSSMIYVRLLDAT